MHPWVDKAAHAMEGPVAALPAPPEPARAHAHAPALGNAPNPSSFRSASASARALLAHASSKLSMRALFSRERSVVMTNHAAVSDSLDGARVVNQYVLREELGRGTYGAVLRCELASHPELQLAVKVVSRSVLKRKREFVKGPGRPKVTTAFDDVLREIAVMKKLRQNNVVRLYEVIDDERNDLLYMVMELVSGGQVARWNCAAKRYASHARLCRAGPSLCMSEPAARRVLRDVASGLDYLHRQGVVHRDLKPENLLLSEDASVCKICDFGVSLVCEVGGADNAAQATPTQAQARGRALLRDTKGTFAFQAPEAVRGDEYSGFGADVWALGVCAHAFLFGALPYYADAPPDLLSLIANSGPVRLPDSGDDDDVSPEARAFCLALLERDPAKRPANGAGVKALPWLEPMFAGASSRSVEAPLPISSRGLAGSASGPLPASTSAAAAPTVTEAPPAPAPAPAPAPPAADEPDPTAHALADKDDAATVDDPGAAVSVDAEDIRAAITKSKLNVGGIAMLKVAVGAWRRRALGSRQSQSQEPGSEDAAQPAPHQNQLPDQPVAAVASSQQSGAGVVDAHPATASSDTSKHKDVVAVVIVDEAAPGKKDDAPAQPRGASPACCAVQ